jgi:hypothetical protein
MPGSTLSQTTSFYRAAHSDWNHPTEVQLTFEWYSSVHGATHWSFNECEMTSCGVNTAAERQEFVREPAGLGPHRVRLMYGHVIAEHDTHWLPMDCTPLPMSSLSVCLALLCGGDVDGFPRTYSLVPPRRALSCALYVSMHGEPQVSRGACTGGSMCTCLAMPAIWQYAYCHCNVPQ